MAFGFDYFYFGYRPLGGDEVRWNAAGYYEPVRSGPGLPLGTLAALLIGFGVTYVARRGTVARQEGR